jgi:YfiH family protein
VSRNAYAALNVAGHVGDDEAAVDENRRRLRAATGTPAEPVWLTQVHGTRVIELTPIHAAQSPPAVAPEADAAVARCSGRVCAIATADCLPVVLADDAGARVGVAHAGWRGLAGGVLEATVRAMEVPAARLTAWLGPAISAAAFEVGPEVRDAFMSRDAIAGACFVVNARGRYQADLYALARLALSRLGVERVAGGGWCTYANDRDFYSYRRDGRTGRMVTLAWLA